MLKLKTNRSANKRYRITKTIKIMRKKAFKSHFLEKKSSKKKRNLQNCFRCFLGDTKNILKLLNY